MGGPSEADDLEVVREGLCYRPVAGGSPICGRMGDLALGKGIKTRAGGDGGVYVAAGASALPYLQSFDTDQTDDALAQVTARGASLSHLGLAKLWLSSSRPGRRLPTSEV